MLRSRRVYKVGLKNNNNNKNVDCTNDINEIQHDDEFARRYLPQMTKERNKSLNGKNVHTTYSNHCTTLV